MTTVDIDNRKYSITSSNNVHATELKDYTGNVTWIASSPAMFYLLRKYLVI